ncbi:MAG: helix-turn-helix domain-containing protein [Acetanaerobacterium sp.]
MDVNITVANNLRAIRDEKRLSLDGAAKLTGVSKSMLGQIERGEVNPTITVLWKIANGFKISFSSIIEQPLSQAEIIRSGDIAPLVEDNGNFINYPVFPFDESRRFEYYRIEIKPRGSFASSPHLGGTEEFITVFTGSVAISFGGQEHVLQKGDSIRFKADVDHGYRNDGDAPTELSMIIYYAK